MEETQVVGWIVNAVGGLVGALGGFRIAWFALERKLDDRYAAKSVVTSLDSTVSQLEERVTKTEHSDALVMKELQHLTAHINERIVTTLESLTEELREMRRDQEKHARVQERHAATMEMHSKSLTAFQSWAIRTTATQLPLFPIEGDV